MSLIHEDRRASACRVSSSKKQQIKTTTALIYYPDNFYRSGDKVQHFKIFKDEEKKYYLWIRKFPSLNQLVEYHKTNSVSKTQHILLNEVEFRVSVEFNSSHVSKLTS